MKTKCVALAMFLAVAPATAQVGYPPSRSPYQDLRYRQGLSLLSGYYFGREGKAGVAPGGGPLLGVLYEIRVGGPAHFRASLASARSERTVLDPARSAEQRVVGERSAPLYFANVGLTLNVTGQKSYRGIVPTVHAAAGVASDGGKKRDVGDFRVGTPFALDVGGGFRRTMSGRYELRASVSDYLFQISYPGTYSQLPEGGGSGGGATAILPNASDNSEWKHNPVLSIGLTYRFVR